ncbi:aldo/keto reductase [Streptomyces sp. NPDC046931]|uniref:aldo/keto reductase n=1 Tax=Streptomyces sp. NPDC046931 TaxID=3154806 RepID=UPI0033E76478
MEHRALGSQGLTVGTQGLGSMGMSAFYGATDETESLATIHRAPELGVTLLDTAESYGPFINEQLLGKALAERREDAVLATKTGVEITDAGRVLGLNGRPEYVRRSLERSLRHLGTDHVDLYYLHRVDPQGAPSRTPSAPWPSWSPKAGSATSGLCLTDSLTIVRQVPGWGATHRSREQAG